MRTVNTGRFVSVAEAERVRKSIRKMIDEANVASGLGPAWLELLLAVELYKYRRECQGLWLI